MKQSESLVVGRMVKSRNDGLFSGAALCGRCYPAESVDDIIEYQYTAYRDNLKCHSYWPYLSQTGFIGVINSALDEISPFTPTITMKGLRVFKSAVFSAVLSLIILWFWLESGYIAALFVLAGIVLTPWFTYLGNNLWYCVWTNYLPFMVLLFLLRKESQNHTQNEGRVIIIGLLALMANFLINGYEWVSTTLVMAVVPFIYYWRKDKWPFKKLIRRLLLFGSGSLATMLATFSLLAYQISIIKGSYADGINWIIYSFLKRSYGDTNAVESVYEHQINHSLGEVFNRYFYAVAFKLPAPVTKILPHFFRRIYFIELLIIFLLLTLAVLLPLRINKLHPEKVKTMRNMAVTMWVSILAPFSWYLIFKGHAYSHAHINYITWFMPFCLFGLALLGSFLQDSVHLLEKKSTSRGS